MISVIIPTYNRALFLKEAIDSVLDQDYFSNKKKNPSYEILVIDDGSTDMTKDIVFSYNNRVKYYFQSHKGVSAARNAGLRLAKGQFIAFLDSDDLWNRNKMTVQMSLMMSLPKAMVCYSEETWIRKGVFVNPQKKHRKYSGWIFNKVLPLCLVSLSSALFRREVFDKIGVFDEEFPVCEDYDFGIRLAYRYPLHFITKSLIVKRGGHQDQLSRKYWGMDRFRVKALQKALRLDLSPQQAESVKREIVRKSIILVQGFRKRNKGKEAEDYLNVIEKYGSIKEDT